LAIYRGVRFKSQIGQHDIHRCCISGASEAVAFGSAKNGTIGSLSLFEIVGDLEEDDADGKEDDGQPPTWYDRSQIVPY